MNARGYGMYGATRHRLAFAALALALTAGPRAAHADADTPDAATPDSVGDDDSSRPRPVHGAIAGGGFLAVTGPVSTGLAGEIEVFPGGALGRIGFGGYARTLERESADAAPDDPDDPDVRVLLMAAVCREAGASRPRFVLTLHAGAGLAVGRLDDALAVAPAIGGGARFSLGVVGPIAAAATVTGVLIYDGLDSSLALATVFTLGLAL